MSDRTRLENRRPAEILEFSTYGPTPIRYTASIGRFPDGRLAEAFLRSGKAGTDINTQAMEAAILLSFALQYGAPAERLRSAMPRTAEGNPEGAIGMLLDILAGDGGKEGMGEAT